MPLAVVRGSGGPTRIAECPPDRGINTCVACVTKKEPFVKKCGFFYVQPNDADQQYKSIQATCL